MMRKDYGDLLERARDGNVTLHELAAVVDELRDPGPDSDLGRLIVILAKAHVPAYKPVVGLVEQFLEGPYTDQEASRRIRATVPEPWMLTRIATRIVGESLTLLCLYWHLTPRYTAQLLGFIRGVSWDWERRLQWDSLVTAGRYLRNCSDLGLLRALIEMFENESDTRVRNIAYIALHDAMGHDPRQRPTSYEASPLLIDQGVIQEAHQRRSREEKGEGIKDCSGR